MIYKCWVLHIYRIYVGKFGFCRSMWVLLVGEKKNLEEWLVKILVDFFIFCPSPFSWRTPGKPGGNSHIWCQENPLKWSGITLFRPGNQPINGVYNRGFQGQNMPKHWTLRYLRKTRRDYGYLLLTLPRHWLIQSQSDAELSAALLPYQISTC